MQNRDKLGEYTRAFQKILVLLIANWKLAEMEHDILYLNRFPSVIQQKVWECLLITKQDVHPDDPYPMSDIITIIQFLLTGSAFRSLLPPAMTTQPSFIAQPIFAAPHHQQLTYTPPHPPLYITPINLAFNPAMGIKVEAMQATRPALLCKFCAGAGHFTHTCTICMKYLNTGKVVQGMDGRLYMPDRSEIPRIAGGRCLKNAIDYTWGIGQASQPSTSASTSTGFTQEPPPHITAGIFSAMYPEILVPSPFEPQILTQHLYPQHSSNICSPSRMMLPHDKYWIGY